MSDDKHLNARPGTTAGSSAKIHGVMRCIWLMPLVAAAAIVMCLALAYFAEASVATTWIGSCLGSAAPSPTSPCRSDFPARRMHLRRAAFEGREVKTP